MPKLTRKDRRQYLAIFLAFGAFTVWLTYYSLDKKERLQAQRAANEVIPVPPLVPATGHIDIGPEYKWRGTFTGPAQVYDGDTIRVAGIRMRLASPDGDRDNGMDAPELRQTCGIERWACGIAARDALVALTRVGATTCREVGQRPSYGRPIVVCHNAAGKNINRAMIDQGWAVEYLYRYREDGGVYDVQYGEASRDQLGIWASRFEWPWVWRSLSESEKR